MEAPKSKYNLTFWQLFLVIVLALVLGGFIFYFAYGNILQDELYSISFTRHNAATTTPSKIPAKTTPKK